MSAFVGNTIARTRKLHVADEALDRALYKYGGGKRMLHRANWNSQAFQINSDIDNSVQKTLCTNANNLKRAYERQISEDINIAQFETTIELYEHFHSFIHESVDLLAIY